MSIDIAADIATLGRITAVPAILQVIHEQTGLRFAAVARVTEDRWTACAVLDLHHVGIQPGDALDVTTTLCHDIRATRRTIVIDHAREDTRYCRHQAPRLHGFESYISVPIIRADGRFFGTLCALDARPAALRGSAIVPMMEAFARLLSIQIASEESAQRTEHALLEERAMADVREHFIAVLGHDLRNPLFAISAGAELLAQRLKTPRDVTIARHIQTCGKRASQLVRDVLDFARGRLGGGIVLDIRPCPDLDKAIEHVALELHSVHPQRDIRLCLQTLHGVHCDRERIMQLLSNLIANALTHGASDGPITVQAEVEDEVLRMSVHNQGEPIPTAILAHLFQPFTSPVDGKPRQGLGLGLYIANQIAMAHGGRLSVVSTQEAGTAFTFTLPLTQALPQASDTPSSTDAEDHHSPERSAL
ncbi:GAF domain-containing sensor histidine kinase [Pseudomonas entomophila]|uniref:GAF domain-containing sensor histidine kinase n=1 Tax=Pseudomonas entomophila TaxID=312306 RepID=UPI0015E3C291|nr:GAF domain-containing sensor histidine kinase [Pseudomonas entomophila]MBA1188423.1 GAF domain-containing sensor histidine kinase [Pseudomonas entomophila]